MGVIIIILTNISKNRLELHLTANVENLDLAVIIVTDLLIKDVLEGTL